MDKHRRFPNARWSHVSTNNSRYFSFDVRSSAKRRKQILQRRENASEARASWIFLSWKFDRSIVWMKVERILDLSIDRWSFHKDIPSLFIGEDRRQFLSPEERNNDEYFTTFLSFHFISNSRNGWETIYFTREKRRSHCLVRWPFSSSFAKNYLRNNGTISFLGCDLAIVNWSWIVTSMANGRTNERRNDGRLDW